MNKAEVTIAERLAEAANVLQLRRTGHAPKAVSAVLSGDTLVVIFQDALTPAEKVLAQTPDGAAKVQEFHRQLFANSTDEMPREIKRITGREVRELTATIDSSTSTSFHAFTTGAMVQLFLLTPLVLSTTGAQSASIASAEDDGLRVTPIVEG